MNVLLLCDTVYFGVHNELIQFSFVLHVVKYIGRVDRLFPYLEKWRESATAPIGLA